MTGGGTEPVRIANCSGFYGDRLSAAAEMVDGGHIDVLWQPWEYVIILGSAIGTFFVANPIDRYSISPRQPLQANADGSIDILIQHKSPGKDKESNWLPAPDGRFILMMRLYWPDEGAPSILDGSWSIPAVKKAG